MIVLFVLNHCLLFIDLGSEMELGRASNSNIYDVYFQIEIYFPCLKFFISFEF